ncbi:MAG: RNA polymerase sigma factor [Clostridia bacterium]|nr:RNA polymerase sigma factor [Clostridia bacterium]
MDDSKIVDLFLRRDETALKLTEAKYGKRLFGLASSILGDKETASECVNDTLLKAWDSIPPNEPRKFLPAYLLRITRQLAFDRIREDSAKKRSATVTELTREIEECIPSGFDMTEELEAKELKQSINRFLDKLSRDKRDVFIRRYWFCDPVADIAARMGFRESKVKTMLFRTRNELRSYLEKEGYRV